MAEVTKRTVSLPAEHDAYIESKLQSGDYASASEVVRAGLRALRERDTVIEKWLKAEVAPVYDAMTARPGRAKPAVKAIATLRAKRRAH
jgi:antitoxin ParD1/3/4